MNILTDMMLIDLNKETMQNEIKEDLAVTKELIEAWRNEFSNKLEQVLEQNKEKVTKIKDIW